MFPSEAATGKSEGIRPMSTERLVLDDDKLYTREETAEFLSATPRQVARLTGAGRLACVRLSGAAVRHRGSQIRAFIEAATEEASR